MEWSILSGVHVTDAAAALMHEQTRTSLLRLNHLTIQIERLYLYEHVFIRHYPKLQYIHVFN